MCKIVSLVLPVVCLALLSSASSAQHNHHAHHDDASQPESRLHGAAAPVQLELSPRLRALLIREMVAILDASQQILAAIVRGDDQSVARYAQAIHDSFILAQELSEEDQKQLHELAPDGFLVRDEALHQLSASLAEAARNGDQQRQRILFSEMMEACVGCHARFANKRFPQLQLNNYAPEQNNSVPVPGGHHGH